MLPTDFELLRDAFPERPEIGPSLSRVLLDQVASGERPATVRLSRPGRVVAFGRRDTRSPGYAAAVRSARRSGFAAMERLTGGRAAAYTEGAISLTLTIPDSHPAERTNQRFVVSAGIASAALESLGVDSRVGEVEGEYCPGAFSVNARGQTKLVGIGQRMISGAAHIGFVIVVNNARLVREVLDPVYRLMTLEWNPETVGAVEDEIPGIGLSEVETALIEQIEIRSTIEPVALDAYTLTLAEATAARFRSP